MRHININDLGGLIESKWIAKAEQLKLEASKVTDPEKRAEFIKKNPIWNELVVQLKSLSNNKCWYSEAQEVQSDMDVDHFRPKNEAKELNGEVREGYWWLAFDWHNYRLSAIYCNRIRIDKHSEEKIPYGKGSYFPLREKCIAATNPDELGNEVFYLLDPTNPDDPDLLSFNAEGKAVPYAKEDEPWDKERAEVSICLYHLNHTPLKDARQVVWNLCQRKIDELRNISRKTYRTPRDEQRIQDIRNELREMISKTVEFSAVAIACIQENKIKMAA